MAVFEIKNLKFKYPDRKEYAINGLSLTVEKGELLVICGPSGCGKSTLLRQLKTLISPHGEREGEILFEGSPLTLADSRTQASRIGYVSQSPDNQIVTDKVWHELAFGLESLGFDTPTVRGRVAEMASFFGIENWFYKDVTELSGGEKQLLNLASVMVLQPSVLILDEPTSQLDPIAASEFLGVISKINRELGTTVILTEHRLEEAFSMASRVAVMEKGRIICDGTPNQVGKALKQGSSKMFLSMPTAMRIWHAVDDCDSECPVTAAEGRKWLFEYAKTHKLGEIPGECPSEFSDTDAVRLKDIWFRYGKESDDIVKGLSLTIKRGEFLAVLGGNGSGKTTTLKIISGIQKPYRGEVSHNGKIALLPQNPEALFAKKTVYEDLLEVSGGKNTDAQESNTSLEYVISVCRIGELLSQHPYDLSGGEKQRIALAKILLTEPDILLLDEPTKGFDAEFKREFALILKGVLKKNVTVIMVSHDVEFCAEHANRCALLFDGGIVSSSAPREFFSGNSFYTTSANRMARELLPTAVTANDVITACGGAAEDTPKEPIGAQKIQDLTAYKCNENKKLPLWRRITAFISGISAALLFIKALTTADLSTLIGTGGMTETGSAQAKFYAALIALLMIFMASVSKRPRTAEKKSQRAEHRKIDKRTVTASVLILLLVPVTLYVGTFYLETKQYYITSLLVLLECMIPFFLIFEGKKPRARELVIIAVLCAIGVAGRAVLFMLPQMKPIAALAVIAGVTFGGETGFLVGSVSVLVSNMMFGQGPWTPFQMFAFGLIGFLAGLLFKKGMLAKNRVTLCVFGAVATLVIYGGIMNPVAAFIWAGESLNKNMLMTYYITGFPMDLVHSAATAIFLFAGAEPMLEKLERVKKKYGLLD